MSKAACFPPTDKCTDRSHGPENKFQLQTSKILLYILLYYILYHYCLTQISLSKDLYTSHYFPLWKGLAFAGMPSADTGMISDLPLMLRLKGTCHHAARGAKRCQKPTERRSEPLQRGNRGAFLQSSQLGTGDEGHHVPMLLMGKQDPSMQYALTIFSLIPWISININRIS